jgi:NADH:ubiquinone oxidoreductase subunit 5 (subunit L)/multisubunit Na+/H+ antiporter MnhA subunit
VVFVGSALLVMVAWRLIWEVFFRPSDDEIHYHAMPRWTMLAPLLAIGGSVGMVATLNPVTQRFVNLLTGESNALYLIPKGGFANTEFQLSLAIIGARNTLVCRASVVGVGMERATVHRGAAISGIHRVAQSAR